MYACVCHAVTEDRIRACAGGGLRHAVAATRAGSGCGSCVGRLRTLLEQQDDRRAGHAAGSADGVRSVA